MLHKMNRNPLISFLVNLKHYAISHVSEYFQVSYILRLQIKVKSLYIVTQ